MRILTNHSGHAFKMGRNRPVARGPRLSLKNYLKLSIPAPPVSCDYSTKAIASLSEMYLNDQLGDCVIACMGHVEGVLSGNADAELLLTVPQITRLYSAIGGYVPGDPSTDQGCDIPTALNYWQQKGLFPPAHKNRRKITGSLVVNAANLVEVQTSLWLFENLIFGVELPDSWVNPMLNNAGFTWDIAGDPDPDNGHCFAGAGYGPSGVTICTWGMIGSITNAAIAQYATEAAGGELHSVISRDSIQTASQRAPNGFDWSQLLADFDSISG